MHDDGCPCLQDAEHIEPDGDEGLTPEVAEIIADAAVEVAQIEAEVQSEEIAASLEHHQIDADLEASHIEAAIEHHEIEAEHDDEIEEVVEELEEALEEVLEPEADESVVDDSPDLEESEGGEGDLPVSVAPSSRRRPQGCDEAASSKCVHPSA